MGVLLYEMATGRHPFRLDQDGLVVRPAGRAVPPSTLNPSISPSTERTIVGALETGPDRRYRTVSEIALALQFQDASLRDATQALNRTVPYPTEEPSVEARAYRSSPGWAAVLIPTLFLGLVLVSAVYAATVVRPQFEIPSVAGLISGADPVRTRDDRVVQGQAAGLDKAISAVQTNTQKVNSTLGGVRAADCRDVNRRNGMRSLLDE